MVNDEKPKRRGFNYTPLEKEMLLDIVKRYISTIENKSTTGIAITQKQNAWKIIAQEFNDSATSGPRTWDQLRHLYENIKQRIKNIDRNQRNTKQQMQEKERYMLKMREIHEKMMIKRELATIHKVEPGTSQDSKVSEKNNATEERKFHRKKMNNYKELYIKAKLHNARLERKFMIEKHKLITKLLKIKINRLSQINKHKHAA